MSVVVDDERGDERRSRGEEMTGSKSCIMHHDMHGERSDIVSEKMQPRQFAHLVTIGTTVQGSKSIGRDISLQSSTKAETTNPNEPGITSQQQCQAQLRYLSNDQRMNDQPGSCARQPKRGPVG
jgi:hypothetical protein